jgi:hypothetical protein
MNGPVKMFVAAALDEMMAGWLADDANEPLYINVLAPDSETAGAPDPAVIVPIMFIVAADPTDIPAAAEPPITEPDILMLVADKFAPAIEFEPPVIDPVNSNVIPVNAIALILGTPPPVAEGMLPIIFRLPLDCSIVIALEFVFVKFPDGPCTVPVTTALPADIVSTLIPDQASPPPTIDKFEFRFNVPFPVLFIIFLPGKALVTNVGIVKLKTAPHESNITGDIFDDNVNPFIAVTDTSPVLCVTVIKLIAPAKRGVAPVILPLILPLLKLNDPPAVIPVPDVFLKEATSKLTSTFTVLLLANTSSPDCGM